MALLVSPCSASKETVISSNPKDGKRCLASKRNLMPRIHRAAMADLKRQKEEQEVKQKKMFGRPVTDRQPLSNFRSGKWRETLKEREEATGEQSTFRFQNRKKFHEIMLEHEKKSRVTKSKVEKMMRQVESYRPPPPDEDSSE